MLTTTDLKRPCTILHRVPDGTDDYGDATYRDDTEETVCEIQQTRRDEPALGGETSATTWLGLFLADIDLNTASAIVCDGQTFELTGDPWTVFDPFLGVDSHVEATLKRTAGAEDEGS